MKITTNRDDWWNLTREERAEIIPPQPAPESPYPKKPHADIWKPHSDAAKARGVVYTILQRDLDYLYTLDELAKLSGLDRSFVRKSCRTPCLKGLAFRDDLLEEGRKEGSVKRTIRVRGVAAFQAKKMGVW